MMIRKILILALAFSPMAVENVDASVWDSVKTFFFGEEPKPPTIKVLVVHDADSVQLEVQGAYNLYDPHKNSQLGSYFTSKSYPVQALSTGLKWGEAFPGVYQLEIVPDSPATITVINGIEYRGTIYIYDIGGAISVINQVDIEEYLRSTLAEKLDQNIPEEAAAAVAIAARTNAYFQSISTSNPYWNVDAAAAKYKGINSRPQGNVRNAIRGTRYMVLSQTSAYEKAITPFPINVVIEGEEPKSGRRFILADAESQANKGLNAAKILSKAFPDAKIELTHNPEKG